MPSPAAIVPVFFASWIVIGVAGFYFFQYKKDLAFKQKWFAWYVIGVSALFTLFATAMARRVEVFFLVAPASTLIAWLNIRMTTFCPACAETLINQMWWTKMSFCPRCGAPL
jgi:hypothetical protein